MITIIHRQATFLAWYHPNTPLTTLRVAPRLATTVAAGRTKTDTVTGTVVTATPNHPDPSTTKAPSPLPVSQRNTPPFHWGATCTTACRRGCIPSLHHPLRRPRTPLLQDNSRTSTCIPSNNSHSTTQASYPRKDMRHGRTRCLFIMCQAVNRAIIRRLEGRCISSPLGRDLWYISLLSLPSFLPTLFPSSVWAVEALPTCSASVPYL